MKTQAVGHQGEPPGERRSGRRFGPLGCTLSLTGPGSAHRAALLEQALVSGANFLAMLLFVRLLAPADWGVLAFAHALVLFLQGFQRAGVTLPMIALATQPGAGWTQARGAWLCMNCAGAMLSTLMALGLALVLALSSLLAAAWPSGAALGRVLPAWWAQALGLAAVLALPLWLHEFTRRAAVQEGRHGLLAVQGLVYALVLGGVAGGAALASGTSALAAVFFAPAALALPAAWLPALALALASLAATGVYRVVARQAVWARPAWRPPLAVQGAWAPYAGWAGGAHLAYSGYNFGVLALLAGLAGPAAVAVFHAMRLLVQPVAVLVSALDSIDKPRAARALLHGAAALRRQLWRSLRLIGPLVLGVLALLALVGPVALPWFYGLAYADQGPALQAACLVALLGVLSQPLESGLYVARRTRALCVGRALAALAGLLAAWAWVPAGGAAGALLAMALGYAVAAGAAAWTLARLQAGPAVGSAPATAPGCEAEPAAGGPAAAVPSALFPVPAAVSPSRSTGPVPDVH